MSGVETIQEGQDLEKHRQLLDWISPTDYPTKHSDILKHRQEGTGQWFLDSPELSQWLSKEKEILFCPGIHGAGKTMMVATTINHMLQSTQYKSSGVAYVYCNYKAENQDASSVLAALAKQLAQGHRSGIDVVEGLHKLQHNRGTKPSRNEIPTLLEGLVKLYPTVYIVIDALDECQDVLGVCRELLATIRDLQSEHDIRLLATSRLLPDIEDAFEGTPRLEIRASRSDVARFMAGQMYRMPRCVQRDSTLQETIQKSIAGSVDGM
jgi:Cdc6-like AAA superfamily ATPase